MALGGGMDMGMGLPPMPPGMGGGVGAPPAQEEFQIIPVKGGFQVVGLDGTPIDKKIFKNREEAEVFIDKIMQGDQLGPPPGDLSAIAAMMGGGGGALPLPPPGV